MATPDTSNTQASQAPADAVNISAPAAGATEAVAGATAKPAGKAAAKPGKKKSDTADDTEAKAGAADKPTPNPQTVDIWPMRTYQDAGEIKRRGGPSYSVTKRHADALIARGLATDQEPTKTEAAE